MKISWMEITNESIKECAAKKFINKRKKKKKRKN